MGVAREAGPLGERFWVDAGPDGARAGDVPEADALLGVLTGALVAGGAAALAVCGCVVAVPLLAPGFIAAACRAPELALAAAALRAEAVCGGASPAGGGFGDAPKEAVRGVLSGARVAGSAAAAAAVIDGGLLPALTFRFAAATWRALACAGAL